MLQPWLSFIPQESLHAKLYLLQVAKLKKKKTCISLDFIWEKYFLFEHKTNSLPKVTTVLNLSW